MTATISRIDQLIEAARRHLEGLLALRADMAGEPVPERDAAADDDFAEQNLIDAGTAAQRAGVSKQTIRRWVTDHSIGFKRGGRLQVSIPRLRRHTGDNSL
ncbi:hypothetical protein GFL80_09460 [Rhizobium leguminosarum bv. viciae]|uniref:hypothetical protein n=1 Tax=Rhizobium leguminosarum TaxID=384 RepID=UPI001039CDFC|nr:hypothetical protein [Rhizobium leguminosarum]NKK84502.1 hypothetical protein [Rhizobium leguminosarum bv. viciae]TBZ90224.1 hypothetical protein E0H53_10690 [Rhizobium leguminosarum bv. viciae]